jgi:hypothetical protein
MKATKKTNAELDAEVIRLDAIADAKREAVSLDDFYAVMPSHSYIYTPTRETWPASSVNSRLPPMPVLDPTGKPVREEKTGEVKVISASKWLDHHHAVEQMTWAPGLPMLISNRLISDGGWIERNGVTCFNLYRPPIIKPGKATKAGPWLDHVQKVFGDADADHIVKWLAQRVQHPAEKINHALMLGGLQGIGKDTMLEPVKRAVGPWNFSEVSPQHMFGPFNGFLRSVILRISEARDLGDTDRFGFYDHMKLYTAAPPDVLRVNEKNLREYTVPNVIGVIITTNHKTNGIYLPEDDRRHFVAWSDLTKDDFDTDYFNKLYAFYDSGGDRHVTAYLHDVDLASFNPKAPPPKTQAFWEIVHASRAPEDADMADAIDAIGSPDALTLDQLRSLGSLVDAEFVMWLRDKRNARRVSYRLEACGYVAVRNDAAEDGFWKVVGKRMVIYAKAVLPNRDRIIAANKLADQLRGR